MTYDVGGNLDYTGPGLTINGSLAMGSSHLHIKTGGVFTVSSTGTFTGKEIKIEGTGIGTISSGASVTVEELETKQFGSLAIEANCISVTDKIENKDVASITGSGCIDFSGSDYKNTSSGGIFGCTSGTAGDCVNTSSSSSTCEFTGNGDGVNWSDADNWDCVSVPDPKNDNVTIPSGENVTYDVGGNLDFKNSTIFTINGSVDFGSSHLHMKDNSQLIIGSSGDIEGHEIKLESNSTGGVSSGATLLLEQIETKGSSVFTINTTNVTVTDEIKNKESATIAGTGFIDFTPGTFENGGSGGIFGCTKSVWADCDFSIGTLPVELIGFEARVQKNNISLNWVTLSEVNNSRFEIWVSSDEMIFNKIGTVNGAGNSENTNTYQFDYKPQALGIYYFKLVQIDIDGTTDESNVVSAIFFSQTPDLNFYPNPTNKSITFHNFETENIYNVAIFSDQGVLIKNGQVSSSSPTFNTNEIPAGAYVLQLTNSKTNFQDSFRLIKTN